MGRQALMQQFQDAPDPKEDKVVARSKPQSQSTDPRQAVNSKSLVRAGKKIASGAGGFMAKQLRQFAGMASKLGGRAWGPVMLAEELLRSKTAGTDKYGRAIDTPTGFKNAQLDLETADYFATHGSFPENVDFNKRNPQAIFDRIKSQTKAEVTAQMLKMNPVQRARGINRQPTPESLARQQWDTMLTNPQMTQGS